MAEFLRETRCFLFICGLLTIGGGLMTFEDSWAEEQTGEYQLIINTKSDAPEVRDGKGRFEITWDPNTSVEEYVVQYTSDTQAADFSGQVQTDTVPEAKYQFDNIDIGTTYLVRVGYKLKGEKPVWSKTKEFRIYASTSQKSISSGHFVFFSALYASLTTSVDAVGFFIFSVILFLLIWGLILVGRVSKRIKLENYEKNKDLKGSLLGGDGVLTEWKDSLADRSKLSALYTKQFIKNGKDVEPSHSILSIIKTGIRNQLDNFDQDNVSEEVDRDMEKVASHEKDKLTIGNKKKKGSLKTVLLFAELAPMLGLFGTVCGLVVAFYNVLLNVQSLGRVDQTRILQDLSAGIYAAIITTIAGLFVGIILLAFYHTLKQKIDNVYHQWELLYIDVSPRIKPHKSTSLKATVKR